MKMKRDNRGLTLVELIIAVAIASIILLAITVFVRNAMRSYQTAQNAIDLQMESHVLMEQLGAWVMEGNRVEVVPQATLGVDSDVLVIYQLPRTSDLGRMPDGWTRDSNGNIVAASSPVPPTGSKRLVWVQDGGLYTTVDIVTDFDNDATTSIPTPITPEANCICLYMETFTPDWDADRNTVTLEVLLKAGVQEYSLKNEFKVRNGIMATPSPSPTSPP